ncbi:MAG TPA: GNAT family N-acetyltransferase [Nocardioides sp.]|nr:GNAT family N-acetyltransferase [Nocardioides sp.]
MNRAYPRSSVSQAVTEAVAGFDATPFSLRLADFDDTATVLGLLDDAVVWLNSRGITQQWGTRSFSGDPKRVAAAEGWVRSGRGVIAARDGLPAGVLVVGEATAYVPPPTEPELYVILLVAGRDPSARGVGHTLLRCAEAAGRELGVAGLRVDCYAGGDRALVHFYESAGFTRTETFDVQGWPGQVLERRLA